MDQAADAQRERAAAQSTLQGKKDTKDFDVFLCHNTVDKPAIKQIGEQLKERGILPWLDEWELRPGLPWQRLLEEQISQIKTYASKEPELPIFLREMTWVDFRSQEPVPLEQLIWGITGKRDDIYAQGRR